MIQKIRKAAFAVSVAVTLVLPFQKTEAGIPIGHWRSHQAYSDATMSLKAFGQIFVLSDGSLYSYNPDDDAVFTYDKTSGLSDYQITTMAYCKAENSIILVYSNGNMTFFTKTVSSLISRILKIQLSLTNPSIKSKFPET